MQKIVCPAKINLTLRLTGRNMAGYHELTSVFLRITPVDYLTIYPDMTDNVKVNFKGEKLEFSNNILLKTLGLLRADGVDVPPLGMFLEKNISPGTGLGCGSGDAAALIRWLSGRGCPAERVAARVGADVPFLTSGASVALAQGIGERLRPLPDDLSGLAAVVVVPRWRCATPEMFRAADARYGDEWPADTPEAEAEALAVVKGLARGERCGLLPNDFLAVVRERSRYSELFGEFSDRGALAWGLSGSGSAAFGLWRRSGFCGFRTELPWVEDIKTF